MDESEWSNWDRSPLQENNGNVHLLPSQESSFNSEQSSSHMRQTRGYTSNNAFSDTHFTSKDDMRPIDFNNSVQYNHHESSRASNSSSLLHREDNNDEHSSGSIESTHRLFDTVQQRHKSSNRTTVEDPQYLQYLKNGHMFRNDKVNNKVNVNTHDLDDLIIKGVGELSGEVNNTFKNKRTSLSSQRYINKDMNNNNNNNNNSTGGDNGGGDDDDDDDDDPETSNEVLRDANNVYNDMISQNFNPLKSKTNKLPLITPQAMGLNFQNNLGKWVMNQNNVDDVDVDESNSQDISTNHTVADISSSTTHEPNEKISKGHRRRDISIADTPVPFKLKSLLPEGSRGGSDIYEGETKELNDGGVEQSRIELIRKLTPLLMNKDWGTINRLDGSRQNLNNVMGLNRCLPSLIECDLSFNNIRVFNTVDSIPMGLIDLNLANNLLNDIFFHCKVGEPKQPHEEEEETAVDGRIPNGYYCNNVKRLNLSNNQFDKGLEWLEPTGFINLQELNLSNNKIVSLNGLPQTSMITGLNLSGNCINGVIDFASIVNQTSSSRFGWKRIKYLDLSDNNITEIHNIHLCESLVSLNVNGNPLKGVYFPTLHRILPNLIRLQILSSETLYTVGSSSSEGYTSSEQCIPMLNLQELEIPCYPNMKHLKGLPRRLIKLKIDGGEYRDLISWDKIPGSLQTLEIINIQGMKSLPEDPRTEMWFASLQELNLSHNELSSWSNLIYFLPYTHLRRLILTGNEGLQSPLPENAHGHGRMLDRIDLGTQLKRLLTHAVPSLETIEL